MFLFLGDDNKHLEVQSSRNFHEMDRASRSCLFDVACFQTTTQNASKEDGALSTTLSAFCSRGFGQIWSWCSRKHGAPRKTAHKRTRSFGALDVEGELDATSNREKVTRWKRWSLAAISHSVWQTMVAVSYNVRSRFVTSAGSWWKCPETPVKSGSWHDLCGAKLLASPASSMSCLMRMRGPRQVRVLPTSGSCCILWLLLSNAANFDRRVFQMIGAFPMRLREHAPSTLCLQRRRVADELINVKPKLVGGHRFENSHFVLRSALSDPVDWMCQRGTVCVVLPSRVPLAC